MQNNTGNNMYAIAFDLEISQLKQHYGEIYNNAYFEIKQELEAVGFEWTQGSVYLSDSAQGIADVFRAIDRLRSIAWFRASVRDIRAFKVEDWSDMTDIIKNG